jgi:hypothetical protein
MRTLLSVLLNVMMLASSDLDKPAPVLKITLIQPKGILHVRVGNPSHSPLRLWKDSNSWGALRWRVLVVRNGKLITLHQRQENFSMNSPELFEVAPGSSITQNLNVNDGTWLTPNARPVRFISGDTVIVVYDVPFEQECLTRDVWYGVASDITQAP